MGRGVPNIANSGAMREFRQLLNAQLRRMTSANQFGRGKATELRREIEAKNTRHVDWVG